MTETFEKISLEEIKGLAVSDRLETKFIFHKKDLNEILSHLEDAYRVLEVNGETYRKYENHYFDTPDYELYKRHHNGRTDRFKLRRRTYQGSGDTFLELKLKKTNGRSFKKRLQIEAGNEQQQSRFLEQNLSLDPRKLLPSLEVSYQRCTLVSKNLKERITLDTDLSISRNNQSINFEQLVIAEVKQADKYSSPFKELMKKRFIRPVALSKYCLGVASLIPGVKRNNFKPLLITINNKIV